MAGFSGAMVGGDSKARGLIGRRPKNGTRLRARSNACQWMRAITPSVKKGIRSKARRRREAVNDAIVALIGGDAVDLNRIDAIGHTSGWDALAGVSLALTAAIRG